MDSNNPKATSTLEVNLPEKETVVVNAYGTRSCRIELMEVTWQEYVELYDKGFLKFQRDNTDRPEHLPDRVTALRWSGAVTKPVPQKDEGWAQNMRADETPEPLSSPIQPIVPDKPQPVILSPVLKRLTRKSPEYSTPPRRKPVDSLTFNIEVATPKQEPPPQVETPPVFEKRRRKPLEKLVALEAAASELRAHRPQLQANDLLKAAAEKLNMTRSGLSRFYYSSLVSEATRERWLYGEGGRKITRKEQKLNILTRVRQNMREQGLPKPRKKELAEAAAKPLGMTLDSARTYIYDRLTEEEVKVLDLRQKFLTTTEQTTIIKRVRQEMQEQGLPPPRVTDLAKVVAPLLRQKVSSVKVLISKLGKTEELTLLGSNSDILTRSDPAVVREGFLGAVAVLKFRRHPVTVNNLRLVLRTKPNVVEAYLAEHPDIKILLEEP